MRWGVMEVMTRPFYPLPTPPDLGYTPPNNPVAARQSPRERGHAHQPQTKAFPKATAPSGIDPEGAVAFI